MGRQPMQPLRSAIDEIAQADPGRVAVTDGDRSRTYGELARLIEKRGTDEPGGRHSFQLSGTIEDAERIVIEACAGVDLLLMDAKATEWEVSRAASIFTKAPEDGRERPESVLGLCTSGSSGLPKVVE